VAFSAPNIYGYRGRMVREESRRIEQHPLHAHFAFRGWMLVWNSLKFRDFQIPSFGSSSLPYLVRAIRLPPILA